MRIVNKCIGSGATRHRLFKQFLEDCGEKINDLQKMQQVRWLSCANIFQRFLSISNTIKDFFSSLGIFFDELENEIWIKKLTFLTDKYLC